MICCDSEDGDVQSNTKCSNIIRIFEYFHNRIFESDFTNKSHLYHNLTHIGPHRYANTTYLCDKS